MNAAVISSYAYIKENVNYGSLFQYFALESFFKKNGIDSFWIKYEFSPKNDLKSKIKHVVFYKFEKEKKIILNAFQSFCSKYLSLSDNSYTDSSLSCDKISADFFVTGSDQVWGGELGANYLTFVTDGRMKVSFSASFGSNEICVEKANKIYPWLKEFDFISVREKSGIVICNKMGLKAIRIIDPTLLIDSSLYPSKITRQNYWFCYFLNKGKEENGIFSSISELAKKQKKSVFYPKCLQPQDQCKKFFFGLSLDPESWIGMYSNTEYVFSNTFHGIVFAIIFKKPFTCFLQNGKTRRQNERLLDLLEHFGLEERIFNGRDVYISKQIDWKKVNLIISQDRINANDFLHSIQERVLNKGNYNEY